MASNLAEWVRKAKNGDKTALEAVVRSIQEKIYQLSLRMLSDPADAEDAAQEILIKVITHLSQFREECAFQSWVYRIASNHLLSTRKRRSEQTGLSFESLQSRVSLPAPEGAQSPGLTPEMDLLCEEARAACVQAMLVCLERDDRLAFILGDIFEVNSKEGAFILDISSAAFRQRLSRGRRKIRSFMKRYCGLVNDRNPCRCNHHIAPAIQSGSLDPQRLRYAAKRTAGHRSEIEKRLKELHDVERVSFLFRHYPECSAPDSFAGLVKELIESGKYQIFN